MIFTVEIIIAMNMEIITLVCCKITDFRKIVYKGQNEDDLQSKTVIKEFVLRIVLFLHRNWIKPQSLKEFCFSNSITDFIKNRYKGQNLQYQLTKEDELQLKSGIKEIVLKIVFFFIGIDYRHNSVMQFKNSLSP